MELSISSDFNGSAASVHPCLEMIAEAGFTHVMWCHHWNTDFLYSSHELKQIKLWLKELGLKLLDIHASRGVEKCFFAEEEYRRKAGIELVLNRAQMLRELDGEGVLMLHIPHLRIGGGFGFGGNRECSENYELVREQLFRSLDEMMPKLEKMQVAIAVENMVNDAFDMIRELIKRYPAERIGITYDSGHGNIRDAKGLDLLEPMKDRLMALHLDDNDGVGDLHQPPYYGTVNWDRMASLLASSGYHGPMSYEIAMRNTPFLDKDATGPQSGENCKAFLADAYTRCLKFAETVNKIKESI